MEGRTSVARWPTCAGAAQIANRSASRATARDATANEVGRNEGDKKRADASGR
jgi:hypothetical protein